ncbi:MAG TPA: hypothetical protein ACQGQG_10435 [Xylella sp.]
MNATSAPCQQPTRFTKITDAQGKPIIARDENTGLEWALKDIGLFANDSENSDAVKACREVTLGDHTNWRLPTPLELVELVPDTKGISICTSNTHLELLNKQAWYYQSGRDHNSIHFLRSCSDHMERVIAVRDPNAAAKAGA